MKKIFKIPTLIIGIILIGVSLVLFNNRKKDDKPVEDKPVVDNSPKVILESKYTGKSNEEIYKALVDNKERITLEDIKDNDDTIVINSFKLLANHYSLAHIDPGEDTNNGVTFCEILGLITYSKKTMGFNSLCLANIKYKQADAKQDGAAYSAYIRVADKETVDKLNSYGIDLEINSISEDCSTYKLHNDECKDEKNYLISIVPKELSDNGYAMDVEYIKREGNGKYTVRLNGYHLGNGNKVTHDETEDHFEYTVSVKDGHIVFEYEDINEENN